MSSEIENLFTRRALSHEIIMIMLFRDKHMGNKQQHVLCPISQYFFCCLFVCYFITLAIRCGLVAQPNKSLELFHLISRLSHGLTCMIRVVMPTTSRFMMLASVFLPFHEKELQVIVSHVLAGVVLPRRTRNNDTCFRR